MSELVFDEDVARQVEAVYHIGDAVRRRGLVRQALAARPGERVLDAGCGPGFYCAELAEEVGPGGSVVGVDGSGPMLTLAARRCESLSNVSLHEADVMTLPVEDGEVDAAVCVQVLEYVEDATAALAEMRRALAPGGRVVIWDVDWPTVWWRSDDAGRVERVLKAWDEHLVHPALPRTLAERLTSAGFGDVRIAGHGFDAATFDPDAYGVALIGFIAQFVAGRQGVSEAEAQAWASEMRDRGERGEFFFACTQYCFTAARA